MVAGELQAVEANLDLVTDYDGNLLEPMTTPNAQLEKVNFSHFIFWSWHLLLSEELLPGILELCTWLSTLNSFSSIAIHADSILD